MTSGKPGFAVGPVGAAAAIDQAAALLASDPAEAERRARTFLQSAPNDPRAALILGSARRRLGDPKAARQVLEPLAKAYPRAANTHYELGMTRAALGETGGAIAALRHAVDLNRELAEAWRALGDLLFRTGDAAGADAAFAEHGRASVSDPRLRAAAEALNAGRLDEARQRLAAVLAAEPANPDAMRRLAEVFIRQDRYGEAERLLAHVLSLDPDFDGARFSYANALFQQQKAARALAQVEPLLAHEPHEPAYRNLKAACLALLGEFEPADAIHEGLVAELPEQPQVWLNYAHALRTVGKRDAAITAYRRCIALAPATGDAYWGLANLKLAVFTPEEEQAMRTGLATPGLSPGNRLHLNYALGKALEDRRDWAGSFEHYAKGAAERRLQAPYDADETAAMVDRSTALFTDAFFEARRDLGDRSDAPIFIVGLPRSGSTLVEQILASHPEVEGTMELPDIGILAVDLARERGGAGTAYPGVLAGLEPAELRRLGEGYIESTWVQRKLGRSRFIDKMPNNFQHTGLIHLILPQAKIIDVRRHPMASCFSAFKQHFAQGQLFTYDLADVGRYYRDYVRLMTHYDRVLQGRVCRVIYEDLVDDTEREVRRMLDYLGLPFDPACLRFYENDRAVRTVSSEQVRRPIYRDGLSQWRAYEPWLDPLQAALGPALEGWRGSLS